MYIVSITTNERVESVPGVQEVLTNYGTNIRVRLGVHNPDKQDSGLIIVAYTDSEVDQFIEDLNGIEGTEVNFMEV